MYNASKLMLTNLRAVTYTSEEKARCSPTCILFSPFLICSNFRKNLFCHCISFHAALTMSDWRANDKVAAAGHCPPACKALHSQHKLMMAMAMVNWNWLFSLGNIYCNFSALKHIFISPLHYCRESRYAWYHKIEDPELFSSKAK